METWCILKSYLKQLQVPTRVPDSIQRSGSAFYVPSVPDSGPDSIPRSGSAFYPAFQILFRVPVPHFTHYSAF